MVKGASSGPGSRPAGRASKAVSPVPASIPSAALAERERVVEWLNWHAVENRKAADTSFHSSSPARTIDLRARANSCAMHATWISLGKHLTTERITPEPFGDALTRLETENETLRAALKPFADASRDCIDDEPDMVSAWEHSAAMQVTMADFRRAASAIEARRAETLGSVEDESATRQGDAQDSIGEQP